MTFSRIGSLPMLETERLTLRGLELSDAPELHRLCSERDVAAVTRSIPHPYPDGEAERFIRKAGELLNKEEFYHWGWFEKGQEALGGTVCLIVNQENCAAEVGYLTDKALWGKGLTTEAVSRRS